MSQNGKLLTQIMNNLDKPKKFSRPKNQWQDPGEITTIPSNRITMEGVSYPVYAQPDQGPGGMMMPGQDYYFPGASSVTEYPMMAGGGYVVSRSSERKGKTHKVTGPDGTVKYFGDAKLGQHPKDPERKKAFYARHKKNLAGNPYFRAFARETWEEGGELMQAEDLDSYQTRGEVVKQPLVKLSADELKMQRLKQYAQQQSRKEQPTVQSRGSMPDDFRKQLYEDAQNAALRKQLLKGADIATDIMQVGNFVPHPIAQAIGKVGNAAGAWVDATQAAGDIYNGDYGSAAVNLGTAVLPSMIKNPSVLGGYRRSSKYNFGNRSFYVPVDRRYGRMTQKQLMGNRALLGTLGAETVYDSFEDGGLFTKTVTCSNCGHSWKSVDGGADPLTCHNCGGMIKMENGGLPFYQIKGEVARASTDNTRAAIPASSSVELQYIKSQFNKAKDFHEKWMNSPMYNRMIQNSDPENAKEITDQRKKNMKGVKLKYEDVQPAGRPSIGGYSDHMTGDVVVFPHGVGVNGMGTHEFSHSIDRPNEGGVSLNRSIPDQDVSLISKFATNNKKEFSKHHKNPKWFGYVTKPTETRARLNDIRQQASQHKLYDPFNQRVTPEIYQKLKGFDFETGKHSDFDALHQLRTVYNDEQIINLLNSVSKTDTPNTIEMNSAKYGGQMIRRADGSYSQRGLWDNVRANKGSGKKPSKEMLEQEKKIKAKEMKYGGTNNPGFDALPDYVQAKILSEMGYGGTAYSYMQKGGEPDGGMALGQITAVMDKMDKLRQFIQPGSDLEPWISSKLAVMDHYADAVSDYMMYNPEAQGMMEEEQGLPMGQMAEGGSIVDFLASRRIDSSKANRARLAKENGVENYDYSGQKNTELLNILRSKMTNNTTKPVNGLPAPRKVVPPPAPVRAKGKTAAAQEREVVLDNRNVFQKLFNMDEEAVRRFNLPTDVYDAYEQQRTGNKGKNFGIVSKKNARAYFFDQDGNLAVQDEVGFGQDKGEEQPVFYKKKTTPSGTYKMERPKFSAPVADKMRQGYDANNFFFIDNMDPNKKLIDVPGSNRAVRQAMHGIPNNLKAQRSKAFGNNTTEDNYMSAGCINCTRPFLDNPYFDKFNEGLVYVLPEQANGGYIGHDGHRHMSNTPTWAGTYGYAMGGLFSEYADGGSYCYECGGNVYEQGGPVVGQVMNNITKKQAEMLRAQGYEFEII